MDKMNENLKVTYPEALTASALDEAYGKRIRHIRRKKGVTQAQLADRLDYSRVTISRIESGKTSIAVSQLYRIAKALDVDPNVILNLKNFMMSDDAPEPTSKVLLYSIMTAVPEPTGKTLYTGQIEGRITVPTAVLNLHDPNDFFALRALDDMRPELKGGDTVIAQRQDTLNGGEMGVVSVYGAPAMCRVYEQGDDGKSAKLSDFKGHTDTVDSNHVVVIGKVIWAIRKYADIKEDSIDAL